MKPANGGALPAAIELLEKLLPRVRSEAQNLAARIGSLLEQMKKDVARLKGAAP